MPPLPSEEVWFFNEWFAGPVGVALLLTVLLLPLHNRLPKRAKGLDALALAHNTPDGQPIVRRSTSLGAATTVAMVVWGGVRDPISSLSFFRFFFSSLR